MARLIAHGVVLLIVFATAAQVAYAEDQTSDVSEVTPDAIVTAAAKYGLDATDLWGAVNTETEMLGRPVDPLEFLCWTGEAPCPKPPVLQTAVSSGCGWPICGAVGQRIYCIEAIESRHGAAMYNPTPIWDGEHAQGWLGFIPSTARTWGAIIGSRASEWAAAARMLASGAGSQFAGVAWGRC